MICILGTSYWKCVTCMKYSRIDSYNYTVRQYGMRLYKCEILASMAPNLSLQATWETVVLSYVEGYLFLLILNTYFFDSYFMLYSRTFVHALGLKQS